MRKILLLALAVVAFVAGLAWADRALEATRRGSPEMEGAKWIWISGSERRQVGTVSFLAVRDVALPEVPRKLDLLIIADEEYVARVNGTVVGAGLWEGRTVPDRIAIGDLVHPGRNRVVLELRSARGAGGVLAALLDGEGKRLAVTDGSWTVYRTNRPAIFEGEAPLKGGEAPLVWGRPPVGRWGGVAHSVPRPRWEDRLLSLEPWRSRILSMTDLPGYETGAGERPPVITFDFGRPVEGFLTFTFRSKGGFAARLFTGLELPDPVADFPAGAVVPVPGFRTWIDPKPRRLRFATLVGVRDRVQASLQPIAEPLPVEEASPETRGVLGLTPPRLNAPIQDEVRSELEGVTGVPGR